MNKRDAESSDPARNRASIVLVYVVVGLLTTALVGGVKIAFEHSETGHDFELWVFEKLQGQLSSIDRENPIVLVDISGLPGGRSGQPTPRKPLMEIVGALAEQRPRAIAVDVEFSPKADDFATEDDPEFFDFCLDLMRRKNLPIFLAVGERKAAPPEAWLGQEEYKELAVAVAANENDTRRLPLSVRAKGAREELKTMGYALAKKYREDLPGAPWWIDWAVEKNVEGHHAEAQADGSDLVYAERLVNYSKLDAMESAAQRDVSAESVRQTGRRYRDKLVILGAVTEFVYPDSFNVPGRKTPVGGVLLHASAAYTLIKEPLFELKPRVRLLLDFVIAGIIIAMVAVIRFRNPGNPSWHGKQAVFIYAAILTVFVAGWVLVRLSGVMWLDFLLVAGALFLHPKLEGLIHMLGGRRARRPGGEGGDAVEDLRPEDSNAKADESVPANHAVSEPHPSSAAGAGVKMVVWVIASVLALAPAARAQQSASLCPERVAAVARAFKGKKGACYFRENKNSPWQKLSAADVREKQFRAGQELCCDKGCSVMILLCGTGEEFEVQRERARPYRVLNAYSAPPRNDPYPAIPARASNSFRPDNPSARTYERRAKFFAFSGRAMGGALALGGEARPSATPTPAVAAAAGAGDVRARVRATPVTTPTPAAASATTPTAASAAASTPTSATTPVATSTSAATTARPAAARSAPPTSRPEVSEIPDTGGEVSPDERLDKELSLGAALSAGNTARDASDYAAAERAYLRAALIAPTDARAYYGLGNVYADQRKWDEAERAYRRAIESEPRFGPANSALGFVLSQPGADGKDSPERLAAAESSLWRAAELQRGDDKVYDLIAVVLEKRGADINNLLSAYRRAVSLNPGSLKVRLLLSGALARAGKGKEAGEQLKEAAELARGPRELMMVAEALESRREYGKSERLLRRALSLEPRQPQALYALGRVLVLRRQYGKAVQPLKDAAEVIPQSFPPRFLLALTYLKQRRPAEAEQALAAAAGMTPPEGREQLALAYGFSSVGDAYAEAGRLVDAGRAYERALGFDAEDVETREKLSELRARLKP